MTDLMPDTNVRPDTSTVPPPIDGKAPKPTYEEMVTAVTSIPDINRPEAKAAIAFLIRVHADTSNGDGTFYAHHLDDDEIATVHPTLDKLMVDGARPVFGDGTPHDVVNRGILNTDAGEQTFLHGKSGGVVRNCTVTVVVETTG